MKKRKAKTPLSKPAAPIDSPAAQRAAADRRRAEVTTVMWMTSAVFTTGGEVLCLLAMAAIAWEWRLGDPRVIRLVGQMGLLIACVTGLLCLALTPLVLRFRRDPPPPTIVWCNLAIALAPWLTTLLQWLGGR